MYAVSHTARKDTPKLKFFPQAALSFHLLFVQAVSFEIVGGLTKYLWPSQTFSALAKKKKNPNETCEDLSCTLYVQYIHTYIIICLYIYICIIYVCT